MNGGVVDLWMSGRKTLEWAWNFSKPTNSKERKQTYSMAITFDDKKQVLREEIGSKWVKCIVGRGRFGP